MTVSKRALLTALGVLLPVLLVVGVLTHWSGWVALALLAVIGAMIAVGIHHRSALGAAIRGQYIRWVIYMLIIGLLPGLQIDNAAHIGGLAGGFGVAYFAGLRRREDVWQERVWQVASYLCILVTVLSFFRMYRWLTGSGS